MEQDASGMQREPALWLNDESADSKQKIRKFIRLTALDLLSYHLQTELCVTSFRSRTCHHVDADPDSEPKFYTVGKQNFTFAFIHSGASLLFFIFLIIVIGVIIFNILDSIWKYSEKSIVKL